MCKPDAGQINSVRKPEKQFPLLLPLLLACVLMLRLLLLEEAGLVCGSMAGASECVHVSVDSVC